MIPGLGRSPGEGNSLLTPVFRLGESHGLYSPWGRKELDTTEQLSLHFTSFKKNGIVFFCKTVIENSIYSEEYKEKKELLSHHHSAVPADTWEVHLPRPHLCVPRTWGPSPSSCSTHSYDQTKKMNKCSSENCNTNHICPLTRPFSLFTMLAFLPVGFALTVWM